MEPKLYRTIVWVGSSLKDLRTLPTEVRREIGHALHMEEVGERSHNTKVMKGFSGIIEILSDYMTNAYRAMYAVKLDDKIYVLHVFQKKSKKGIATPKTELDIIKGRLLEAKRMAKENLL